MRKKISVACMTAGVLLLAAAISLAIYNQIQDRYAADAADSVMRLLHQEIEMQSASSKAESNIPETDFSESNPDPISEKTASEQMAVVEIDGYGYIGYLSIPSLSLELPIMSEWDYTRLKIAPCLYYGSVKTDNMVIAAHNYTGHFGKLPLLKHGDTVRFTDMEGKVYNYQVGDIEILPAAAAGNMIESGWELSLYTCTYDGRSRVTVRCEQVDFRQ